MSEKSLKTRIQNRHDTQANWAKATGFFPREGELIIYDVDEHSNRPRFKIGDNTGRTADQLPFMSDDTLSIEGAFADAKTVGTRIAEMNSKVNGLQPSLTSTHDGQGDVTLHARWVAAPIPTNTREVTDETNKALLGDTW